MAIIPINDDAMIIDKILVLRIDGELCIVNSKTKSTFISSEVRAAIKDVELTDFQTLYNMYPTTCLIPAPSTDLLEKCKTQTKVFCRADDDHVHTIKSKAMQGKNKVSEFAQEVVAIRFNNVLKYFYNPVVDDAMRRLNEVTISTTIRHERDNSLFYGDLNLDQYQFTEEDSTMLEDFSTTRFPLKRIIMSVFAFYYAEVKSKYTKRRLVNTFEGGPMSQGWPKLLHVHTFRKYSHYIAQFIYLIMNFSTLSFYDPILCPMLASNFTIESINATSLSAYILTLISDTTYTNFWMTLVKLLAFKWNSLNGQAGNELYAESTFRKIVDAIRAFVTYATCYAAVIATEPMEIESDHLLLDGRSEQIVWMNNLYTRLIRNVSNDITTQVPLIAPDTVMVNGKYLSKLYIQAFYEQMKNIIDNNIEFLRGAYDNIKSVIQVAREVLTNPQIHIYENRSNPLNSLLLLFPAQVRLNVNPTACAFTDISSETVIAKIEEIGRCLMWMIYLASGGPYRFPEMAILKYAGNDRNVFIDPVTRQIDLITGYSKSRAFNLLLKRLDPTTSAYLFHYIMVERLMMRHAVGDEFLGISRDLFEAMSEDDKLDALMATDDKILQGHTDRIYNIDVLQSFVFIRPSTGCLLSYSYFSTIFKNYPSLEGQTVDSRLNLRELRQGIVALTRHCIVVSENTPNIIAAKELIAGHSVTTAYRHYGVDNSVGLGDEMSLLAALIVEVSKAWQKWLGFGYDKDRIEEVEEVPMMEELVIRGSADDLLLAGRHLYGNEFEFREGQQFLMNEIYNSTTKLLPIQALPGYGKTALFQLPLIAIKRRYPGKKVISFVLVPYSALMADMIMRLNSGDMVAEDAAGIDRKNETEITADIYVGCYESLKDDNLRTVFSNWRYRFRNVHLGFLVIDEFHNVGFQGYRQGVTTGFNILDTSSFSKVILMSGTIGYNRFGLHLKAMGISGDVTDAVEDSDKIRVFDLVKEIPLRNVVKTIIKVDNEAIAEQNSIAVVNRFLALVPHQKIIMVCSSRAAVERLGALLYGGKKAIWVHGNLPRDVKLARSTEFLSSPECRVLIGTCLVSEGIDVPSLGAVVLCNYVPSLTEFIQIGGRLRRGGNYIGFWSTIRDKKDDFPPFDPRLDINLQIANFYGCGGNLADEDMPRYRARRDMLLATTPIPANSDNCGDESLADDSLIEWGSALRDPDVEPEQSGVVPAAEKIIEVPDLRGSQSTLLGSAGTPMVEREVSGTTSAVIPTTASAENNGSEPSLTTGNTGDSANIADISGASSSTRVAQGQTTESTTTGSQKIHRIQGAYTTKKSALSLFSDEDDESSPEPQTQTEDGTISTVSTQPKPSAPEPATKTSSALPPPSTIPNKVPPRKEITAKPTQRPDTPIPSPVAKRTGPVTDNAHLRPGAPVPGSDLAKSGNLQTIKTVYIPGLWEGSSASKINIPLHTKKRTASTLQELVQLKTAKTSLSRLEKRLR